MKTNQFNLTVKRHSMDELMKKIEHDRVYKFRLTDRLGESGIVAVVILERKVPTIWTVDTFVMSCRVIQRGLEYAIMQWICDMAEGLGISYIAAARTPTERNAMTKDFLEHCGFVFGQLKTSTMRIPKTYIQGLS
jgi:FkbH-like protein